MQRVSVSDSKPPVRPADPLLHDLLSLYGLGFHEIVPTEPDRVPLIDGRDIHFGFRTRERDTLLGLLKVLEHRNAGLAAAGRREQTCLCVAVPRTMLSVLGREDTRWPAQTVCAIDDHLFRYQHVLVTGRGNAPRTYLDLGDGEVLAEIECTRLHAYVNSRFQRQPGTFN